jgi:hypothetical protein
VLDLVWGKVGERTVFLWQLDIGRTMPLLMDSLLDSANMLSWLVIPASSAVHCVSTSVPNE